MVSVGNGGWPWVWDTLLVSPQLLSLLPRRQRVPALRDLLPALQQHQGLPHLQLRQELHEDGQHVQSRRSGRNGGAVSLSFPGRTSPRGFQAPNGPIPCPTVELS